MSNRLRSIMSIILLIAFSWFSTPKEIIHLFSNHHDTLHVVDDGVDLHFSAEHHHCELLKVDQHFTAPTFDFPYFDFEQISLFYLTPEICFYTGQYAKLYPQEISPRGPPNV